MVINQFYYWYLHLAANGFTEKAKKWSGLAMQEGYDLSVIQHQHHTLTKLWVWEKAQSEEPGIPG